MNIFTGQYPFNEGDMMACVREGENLHHVIFSEKQAGAIIGVLSCINEPVLLNPQIFAELDIESMELLKKKE